MSHTMDIKIELHDRSALEAACKRLNIKIQEGRHKLHATTEEGIGVFLNGWRYPVIVKDGGIVSYDNYNGAWGNTQKLHELEAYYGLEYARATARNFGYNCLESESQFDKMPCLEISIGGAL